MSGDFLEVCDCFTVCPCWIKLAPSEGKCTGVFAWSIDQGRIDGTDVSDRCVVSVSTHEGAPEGAHQRVMLFIDEGASDRQVAILSATFAGLSGGPLAGLAPMLGELIAVRRAAIDISFSGRRASLTVGRIIAAQSASLLGANGQATVLSHARLSTVLGEQAEVGISQRFKVSLPTHGMDCDLKGRSAMRGSFHYANEPAGRR